MPVEYLGGAFVEEHGCSDVYSHILTGFDKDDNKGIY